MDNDKILVRQALAGNSEALSRLYDRYANMLYIYIAQRVSFCRADVEDIWQECWLSAVKSLWTFSANSSYFSWLCGIAKHKISDYYQQKGIAERRDPIIREILLRAIDDGNIPEDALLKQEVKAKIVEVLSKLPKKYQDCLIMRYIHKNSVKELSEIIGKSYKATESLLSRARFRFRQEWLK